MTEKIPYNFVAPTAYGQMILNRNDINQTESFVRLGRSPDHREIEFLIQVINLFNRDRVFFDVGANVGAYSLAMSKHVGPRGKVYAFEPQRILYNMFCGSLALNSIENVHAFNVALGKTATSVEIPQYDYDKPLNFGSIEFRNFQREKLTQERGTDPSRKEFVGSITLDSVGSVSPIDVIKIDVEGMEIDVVEGAEKTILREQPFLFVEFQKSDGARLGRYLMDRGYVLFAFHLDFFCIPNRFKDFDGPWNASEMRDILKLVE